jgi:hypothetical protein
MSDVNPRIVDGEPVCSGAECPSFEPIEASLGSMSTGGYCLRRGSVVIATTCTPGLRRQRDEARREVCVLRAATLPIVKRDPGETSEQYQDLMIRAWASVRDWQYLYEK